MTTLHVSIGGLKDSAARVRNALARFGAGETVDDAHIAFETRDLMDRVLGDDRKDLLRRLLRAGAADVASLARDLGRPADAIRADAEALADLGFVERGPDGTWRVGYDDIQVEGDPPPRDRPRLTTEAVPTASPPDAVRFAAEGERIVVAPPEAAANDPAAAQPLLDELRDRAARLADRMAGTEAAMPFLAAEALRLRDSLPDTVADLHPFRLRARLVGIDAAMVTLGTAGPALEAADDLVILVMDLALTGRDLMLRFAELCALEREEIARAIAPGHEMAVADDLASIPAAAADAPEVVAADAATALANVAARTLSTGPDPAQRERVVEEVAVVRNFRSGAARVGRTLWDHARDGAPAGADGFARLTGALTRPTLGLSPLFVGYGQIDHGLTFLQRRLAARAGKGLGV